MSTTLSALGRMLERARAIEAQDVDVLNEVAYQQQLAGNYAGAVGTYREAARVAEMDGTLDNLDSLYGTTPPATRRAVDGGGSSSSF